MDYREALIEASSEASDLASLAETVGDRRADNYRSAEAYGVLDAAAAVVAAGQAVSETQRDRGFEGYYDADGRATLERERAAALDALEDALYALELAGCLEGDTCPAWHDHSVV